MKITFIAGLYNYTRNGIVSYPKYTIPELIQSIKLNPWYKDDLVCYSDSQDMGKILSEQGCYLHKVLDDAPTEILKDSAHKMKHWMMYNAAKEFQNVVWVDWDTYNIKPIDQAFTDKCFSSVMPKFTFIRDYWATVNCSVYYLNEASLELMEKSFYSKVEVPNDELMWKSVLPKDIHSKPEYWMDDFVINIWNNDDFRFITDKTYFLHLKNFQMLKSLKS